MRRAGKKLMIICGLHQVVGLVFGWPALSQIATDRIVFVDALEPFAAFWFLFAGFIGLIFGATLDWIERRGPAPSFIAWSLLALAAAGALLMPVSGFWLVLALASWMLLPPRIESALG